MHKTRLIAGCGYVGERVAKAWKNRGDRVLAITRSALRAAAMEQQGWEPLVWDWLDTHSPFPQRLPRFDSILIAVSHAPVAGLPAEATHTKGLDQLWPLVAEGSQEARWIYLSTTGVFAPVTDGSWVDESSPVDPTRPGSIAALAGERWIESHLTSAHRVALRPAGIYGPGRVPRWESIRDGVALRVDPDSYLNLIHVDDLALAIETIADAPTTSPIYCISDGHSPTRREYYQTISEWMHWPAPVFDSTAQRQTRSEGNKRVSPARLLSEMPIRFAYPSYREGLRSLLSELTP
ncbi:MAG: NAD-dependent epimerase/dehydratase family protein [Planctomycetota bacterium]|jgi:nucleoside-diphosphate-sugar epimerase